MSTGEERGAAARDAEPGRCHDGVCLTCSDEALPVTVLAVEDDDLAWVDTGSTREQVSIALVEAAVGDRVLVHAGEAIARLGDGAERSSTDRGGDGAERSSTGRGGDGAERSSTGGGDPA